MSEQKLRIALLGYGKMGKTIERIAQEKGHEIVLRITSSNLEALTAANLQQADIAIEFSRPESAFDNIKLCLETGVPVVVGTTAWLDRLPQAQALIKQHRGALFFASNFSIGVHVFFALNRYLARMMNEQPAYEVRLEEIHHTQKVDKPSGTAITLVEDLLKQLDRKSNWVLGPADNETDISISSRREGAVPGTHEVMYTSDIDTLTIRHEAHSREGFATGALRAAEWLCGRQGYYGMRDMLGF